MTSAAREALRGLRARGRRTWLGGLGILLAAAMLAAAAVVADGLGTGFARSARAADLPDIIVHFDDEPPAKVLSRVLALPDVATASLRLQATGVTLAAPGHRTGGGVVELVSPGRRGYAIVAGRPLSGRPGEVVVEVGLARAWGLHVGSALFVEGVGPQRVVGLSEAPDNVSYPLAGGRVYLSRAGLVARYGAGALNPDVNEAEIWLRDPALLNSTLVQARATSYGLRDLSLVTRSGVRVLLDQAAGIVVDLLVALSIIALVTAGVMLAAAARAEVQRRMRAIGVHRALGATRGWLTLVLALETFMVAAPAAVLGVAAGALVTSGPSTRLLQLLNELPPGAARLLPLLVACWAVAVAVPVLTAAWPVWRATARPPAALLHGAELSSGTGGRRPRARRAPLGLSSLGARLVAARRVRLVSSLAVLGACAGFVLLMLALASELQVLRNDPGALGRRYQLTASLPASSTPLVRSIPGVSAAAPRYELTAADSFALGETIDVVAYPAGRQQTFENPPLQTGTRARGDGEAEVGVGLAEVLGLGPGSTLALQLPNGVEQRFRVTGEVSSLDRDGRVAYVPAGPLLRADPGVPEQIAIVLAPNANRTRVSARLAALGTPASGAGTAVGKGAALVSALSDILRAVAGVDGLVCLYTLVQALALVAQERRATIAVLRAAGAGGGSVRALLAGAAAVVVLPAAAVGVALERFVLGPLLSHLAADYVDLPLKAGTGQIALLVGSLAVLALGAVAWVAHQATRGPVIVGPRL
ncbi:MAG TPA: FtsX-like permease family protein [Solirubrobacteraceae bacterium]|jgi:ABC-type antimicrobial peptide transport system permease subunit|nr:FtsX-like permease family protein [Solirubrobacteraceae bacterium]